MRGTSSMTKLMEKGNTTIVMGQCSKEIFRTIDLMDMVSKLIKTGLDLRDDLSRGRN